MSDENENADWTTNVLEVAYEAGRILLENGAEIFRVEETMQRIAGYFGVQMNEVFVISNGIFVSDNEENDETRRKGILGHSSRRYAKIEHIPVRGTRLDKVVAVNELSREVCEGRYSLQETAAKLEEIRNMKGKSNLTLIAASAIGAAAFSYLFGGTLRDATVAFVAGLLLYAFMLFPGKNMSKITKNIIGSALVTIICLVGYKLAWGQNLNFMIIGSVMPLIPGVPFVNGIRDIADGDYLSGAIRMLDALLVFLSIAVGVGVVFMIYQAVLGGAIL